MKRKTFGVLFFINKAKLLKSGEAGIYIWNPYLYPHTQKGKNRIFDQWE